MTDAKRARADRTRPKPPQKKKSQKARQRARRRGAIVRAAAASVVLVGLLFAFVYPTRTFLDQRSATNKAREQLALLRSESKRLAQEAKRLNSSAEIERRAREYGLVRPGERPFVIIPAPSTPPATDGTANSAP